ncbi:GDSL-type esterase/lipase family protein [Xanthobacteraceae bacterium A53D]
MGQTLGMLRLAQTLLSVSRTTSRWRRMSRHLLALAILTAGVGLLGAIAIPAPALAQFENPFVIRPPAGVPQPSRSAPNWRPPPTFFGIPLGNPNPPPPPVQQPVRRAPPPEPEGKVYSTAAEAEQDRKQPPAQYVLVVGDRYGRQVAEGLADTYVSERNSPAVVGITDDPSGFLPRPVDWLARLPGAIDAGKPDVLVLALGMDDLEPIRDGDVEVPPFSEKWTELYSRRVAEILTVARAGNRRVVLVGLAPVASAGQSADYEKLNEILRAYAARTGAVFTSVWDGFVDEDGKYMASGPAVDGQRRRLRFNDGVRFTRAGTRKLAFFVQKDLTRLLAEPAPEAAPVADGSTPVSLTAGPRGASALLGGPPLPATSRQQALPMPAVLLPGLEPAKPDATKVLVDGTPLQAQRGRTDDFSWPPAPPPAKSEAEPAPANAVAPPAAPAPAQP